VHDLRRDCQFTNNRGRLLSGLLPFSGKHTTPNGDSERTQLVRDPVTCNAPVVDARLSGNNFFSICRCCAFRIYRPSGCVTAALWTSSVQPQFLRKFNRPAMVRFNFIYSGGGGYLPSIMPTPILSALYSSTKMQVILMQLSFIGIGSN